MFTITNTKQESKLNKHWQFSIGSGHAAFAMRTDYVKQLAFVQRELGFKYVRFHGIFCDDMNTVYSFSDILNFPNTSKFVEKAFHRVGLVYDNVLSCGMKPFVELGFMPNLLAKEKNNSKSFYGANFNMPKNMDDWTDHVASFIHYLIDRYGIEEVSTWYFEVWNEPDLENMFFNGNQKDYFNLYKATVETIKGIDARLLVGGPATSSSRWIGDFVAYCEHEKVPVDFVSTHQYVGDPFIGISEAEEKPKGGSAKDKLSKLGDVAAALPADTSFLEVIRTLFGDPSEEREFEKDIFKRNSAIVKSQAKELPVFYTEWNFSATFSAYSNDTRKAAAYILKTSLDVADNVTGSSVWCFSDIFEEMHQFTEEFHGGFGLLTLNGIPKPTFHAMKMLSKIGDTKLTVESAGDSDIEVAAFTNEEGKTHILSYRYNSKQLDLDKKKVTISVELPNKPNKVQYECIDDTNCNPLSIWEDMGSPKDLRPSEVANIIELSSMKAHTCGWAYQNGQLSLELSLGVNDVYLVEID